MSKSSIGIKHSEVRALALASPAARASYEQELLASARKALARGELIIPISTGTFIEVIEAREAAEKRVAELEESHTQVIQSRDHYKRMSEEGLIKLREARALTVTPPKQKPTDPYSVVPAKNLMAIGYNKALVDYAIVLCRAGISVEKE